MLGALSRDPAGGQLSLASPHYWLECWNLHRHVVWCVRPVGGLSLWCDARFVTGDPGWDPSGWPCETLLDSSHFPLLPKFLVSVTVWNF
jgi:hypothetical protein